VTERKIPTRQHPARHAEAEQRAADRHLRERAEADQRQRQREHEQDAAQHARCPAPVGQRSQRQQRDQVHHLREHEQPGESRPVEPELAAGAQRDHELLDRGVADGDRGAQLPVGQASGSGQLRQQRRERADRDRGGRAGEADEDDQATCWHAACSIRR
jgi:hypothetical protein